jgi:hypothetical protein
MTDIGPISTLSVYLSTNKFKVNDAFSGPLGSPADGGTLTIAGLGGDPLKIPVWSLGILSPVGEYSQVLNVSAFLTATLTVTEYWTYEGLYDPATGAWSGP